MDVGVDGGLAEALAGGRQLLVGQRHLGVDGDHLLAELLGLEARLVELLVEHADLAPLRVELLGQVLRLGVFVRGWRRRRRRRDQTAAQKDHDDRAGP